MQKNRTIDLILSVIASGVALLLSWPFWRDFSYWPESHALWIAYFVVGFLLAVYVFYVFMVSLHTLFEHDALEHAEAAASAQGAAAAGMAEAAVAGEERS